jgi:hypothetical protein
MEDNKIVEVDQGTVAAAEKNDPPYDAFLPMYAKLREFYTGPDGHLQVAGKIPSINDIRDLYGDNTLSKDAIIRRRWLLAQEVLLLDVMIRDMSVIAKYALMNADQQFLTRAIDHFTKETTKWDTKDVKFVVAMVGDEDVHGLGTEERYEGRTFFYRACRDFTYADLLLTKFEDDDLDKVLLAPITFNAFTD